MYNLKGLQKNQNFETLLKDILKTWNIYIVTGIKWMKIWNWNFVSLEAKNLFDKGSSPLIGYLFFPGRTNKFWAIPFTDIFPKSKMDKLIAITVDLRYLDH